MILSHPSGTVEGVAKVEVITLDGRVTRVARDPKEYFAQWREELEAARSRRDAQGLGAWTAGPGLPPRAITRPRYESATFLPGRSDDPRSSKGASTVPSRSGCAVAVRLWAEMPTAS